jgi:hypothetical protein
MPMVSQPFFKLPTLAILYFAQLPKICGPVFTAVAVCEMVARPLAYQRDMPMN